MDNQANAVGMTILLEGAEADKMQAMVKQMLAQFVRDHQREVLGELGNAYANNKIVVEAEEYFEGHGLSLPLVINDVLPVRTTTHTHAHERIAHAHTYTRTHSFSLLLQTKPMIAQDKFGGKSVGAKYLRGTTRLWDEDEKELVDVWENYSKTHVGEVTIRLRLFMNDSQTTKLQHVLFTNNRIADQVRW